MGLSVRAAFAAVQPAGVFTDYAVLQQGVPVRIWGTATSGEKVTVKFVDQAADTLADKDGYLSIMLEFM